MIHICCCCLGLVLLEDKSIQSWLCTPSLIKGLHSHHKEHMIRFSGHLIDGRQIPWSHPVQGETKRKTSTRSQVKTRLHFLHKFLLDSNNIETMKKDAAQHSELSLTMVVKLERLMGGINSHRHRPHCSYCFLECMFIAFTDIYEANVLCSSRGCIVATVVIL